MKYARKSGTFRDLIAWQRGMDLARATYMLVRGMPPSEKFALASQMWRAAYSILSNIAEGYARQTRPEYLKFLRIARGSIAELETHFELATTLEIIPFDPQLRNLIEEEDRILQGLIRSLERKSAEEQAAKKRR